MSRDSASRPGERRFFEDPAAFRAWLEDHHASETELWVGFYKKGSGKPSVSYPEARDEAICFGWIDGLKRRVDDEAYEMRFTPRKPGSRWSAVNVRVVKALIEAGRMAPAGMAAYEAAGCPQEGEAPPAQQGLELSEEFRARFAGDAWEFFQAQPPGYRRNAVAWVMSAKKEATRERRFGKLLETSQRGERLGQV